MTDDGTDVSLLLLSEHSTAGVLQKVIEAARARIPGVAEASVTLLENGRVASVAWTGLLAYELDEAQYESGFGPCLEAARTGQVVVVHNGRMDRRWPVYLSKAMALGALSSLSVPIIVPGVDGLQAGLNLYSTSTDGFRDAVQADVVRFARRAATIVANRHAYDQAVTEVATLREALQSRAVIEQAKGALMLAHGISAEDAFAALAQRSQHTNVKLQAVAADLMLAVAAGERGALDELAPPRKL